MTSPNIYPGIFSLGLGTGLLFEGLVLPSPALGDEGLPELILAQFTLVLNNETMPSETKGEQGEILVLLRCTCRCAGYF